MGGLIIRKVQAELLIGLAVLGLVFHPVAAEDNWSMFRHDIEHTGRNSYVGTSNPNLIWACPLGAGVRNSSPAIGPDGTIYIGANDGYLYAVDPDGWILWAFPIGGNVYSSPAVDTSGTIYVGGWRENGSCTGALYAINPDGTLKWRYPNEGYILDIESSPVIDPVSGDIFIGGTCQAPSEGEVYAITSTGTLKCIFTPDESGWVVASPAIRGDGMIIIGDYSNPSGIMRVIDPADCSVHDDAVVGGDIYSSVAIDSVRERIYFGNSIDTGYKLWAYDFNLDYIWEFNTHGFAPGSPAIGLDGTIFIGSYDENLYAVYPDGTERWRFRTGGKIFSSPAVDADGTAYVGSLDGNIYAVDSSGLLKWSFLTGGEIFSSPAIGSDGRIYVGSMDGYLYAIGQNDSCQIIPPALNFGLVHIGEGSDLSFTIKSSSGDNYLIGTVSESCYDFSIVPQGENPYILAPGESLVVEVVFEPTSYGKQYCTIETGDAFCCDVQCEGFGFTENIPSQGSSSVEPWDSYSHAFVSPGTGACDEVALTIRDEMGIPCAYAWVEVDVSTCSGLCIDSPDGLSGMTDEYGELFLNPRLGGCDDCDVIIWAEGVPIRSYSRISSPDWDGSWADGVVDSTDYVYLGNMYTTSDACADYDGSGFVDLYDVALFTYCYGSSNTLTCPYSCEVVPSLIMDPLNTVAIGSSKDTTFTIRNTGVKTLSGSVLETFDQYSYFEIVIGEGSYSIPGGDSLVVTVRFTPGADGMFPYEVETGDSACSNFLWFGYGVEGPPACEVSPDTIGYGMVTVGSWKDTTFTIKNTGGGELAGSIGESCPCDSILSGGGPYSIPGVDSLIVTLRFEPADTGFYECLVETGDDLCTDVYCFGYGIDTIPPSPPTGFSVAYNTGSGNYLEWNPSEADDFDHFNIYRSDNPDLILPGPIDSAWSVVHSTSDTMWLDDISDGWRFRYQITALDHAGNESDATSPSLITGDEAPPVPKTFVLYQNVPNPFNPITTIRFDLPRAEHVKICVYNVKGELITTLVDQHMTEGRKEVVWTATTTRGNVVASGIYFYRLVAGNFVQTRKMVLLQ